MNALRLLGKLRNRSFDELRVRANQMLHAYAERGGVSHRARLPSDAQMKRLLNLPSRPADGSLDETLLDNFRTRRAPRFFRSFDDPAKTAAVLRERLGAYGVRRIVERAGRIVGNRFSLLGLDDLDFGEPIDWHLEPVSGKRAPLTHWSRIAYLDPEVAGDKKIIWELNRHHHFVTLGRAYLLTGEERYAQTFVDQINLWMDANPPKLGINWASSLEVAFRSIAWLWSLHFFKDSPALDARTFNRIYKFLYIHALHLETYLSTYFSPNTHLSGEALGLYYLGTLLPEFRDGARWRAIGRRVFLDAVARHVQVDGVYFEQASYYHRYTADFCSHFRILSTLNGDPVPSDFDERLTSLLDHLMYITKPDGETPRYGDDDGGRLLALDDSDLADFRTTLRTGAALFGRADYKYISLLGTGANAEEAEADAEEIVWLLGTEGATAFDTLDSHSPADTSRGFAASGFYVMRDAWRTGANYMLIDGGAHGAKNGAHAHADALSFECAAGGRTLLVDPGTYTYTKSLELRDAFRTTAAHNTLTIDGEPSSVHATAFTWHRVAQVSTEKWIVGKRFDFFQGTHDGYMRLPRAPARHTRGVLFLKDDYWIVRDRIESEGAHRYDLHFHFAEGCDPVIDVATHEGTSQGVAAAVRERGEDVPGLDVHTCGFAGAWRREAGWISKAYGARVAAPVCVFSGVAQGVGELITFLAPRAVGAPPTRLRRLEAAGGTACELRGATTSAREERDVLLAADGDGKIETRHFACDGETAWMRLRGIDELPTELVLIEGKRLVVDGVEVFAAHNRTGFFAMRHTDEGRLMIETDAADKWFVAARGARQVIVNGVAFDVGGRAVAGFQAGRLIDDVSGTAERSLQETVR